MKKFNYLLLGAAGLVLASCSQEEVMAPSASGDTANITIALTTPQLQTRYGDGLSATKLQYALYETIEGVDTYLYDTAYDYDFVTSANITISVAKDHSYKVVFWAATPEEEEGVANNPYNVDFSTNTLTVNPGELLLANTDNLDAFYGILPLEDVNGDAQLSISLTRPFAQINVGTNDYDEARALRIIPTQSSVKVSDVANKLDLLTGEISGEAEVEFKENLINKDDNEYPIKEGGYKYLAMAYVLVGEQSTNHDVTYYFNEKDGGAVKSRTVSNVPLQRNHRTNLYGSLLTSSQNIIVDKGPWGDDVDYPVVDVPEGKVKMNDEVYETLQDAIDAAKENGVAAPEIYIGETSEDSPIVINDIQFNGTRAVSNFNSIKIIGAGDASKTVLLFKKDKSVYINDSNFALNFENITMKREPGSQYNERSINSFIGIGQENYKNCIIEGDE